MQPYLFPYMGYFQMINAVDKFILYDDVNFIKGGWINRNYLKVGDKQQLFTLQLEQASSFKAINTIKVGNNARKIIKTITQAYSKAPFFEAVFPLIERTFTVNSPATTIAQVAQQSIVEVCKYLDIPTAVEVSSQQYGDTKDLGREQRLLEICKRKRAKTYINAANGKSLYSKTVFKEHQINLKFISLSSQKIEDKWPSDVFSYSIIHNLMSYDKSQNQQFLKAYQLS